MKAVLQFVRTSVGGGALFLIPLVLAIVLLGKALELADKLLAPTRVRQSRRRLLPARGAGQRRGRRRAGSNRLHHAAGRWLLVTAHQGAIAARCLIRFALAAQVQWPCYPAREQGRAGGRNN